MHLRDLCVVGRSICETTPDKLKQKSGRIAKNESAKYNYSGTFREADMSRKLFGDHKNQANVAMQALLMGGLSIDVSCSRISAGCHSGVTKLINTDLLNALSRVWH